MITESIEKLVSTLEQVGDRKRQLQAEDAMLLMSTKFVDSIEKATDITSLSKAMLHANKTAMSMGMPQMAQMINNLGHIKQSEIVHGKTETINQQKAGIYSKLYGDTMVLDQGEYKPLSKVKEYEEGLSLDPELQPQFYEGLAKKYKTELIKELDLTDAKQPMLKVWSFRGDTGEMRLEQQLAKTSTGLYDNLLTEDDIEQMDQPPEVLRYFNQQKLKDLDKQRLMQDDYLRMNKPLPTQVRIIDDTGNEREIPAYYVPSKNKYFSYDDNTDITTQLVSIKTYKSSDPKDIKEAEVNAARKRSYNKARDLFNAFDRTGLITPEVIKSIAKRTGLETEQLEMAYKQYKLGMNPQFNPEQFLLAGHEAQATPEKGWLDIIAEKDETIELMVEDYRQAKREAKAMEAGRRDDIKKKVNVNPKQTDVKTTTDSLYKGTLLLQQGGF